MVSRSRFLRGKYGLDANMESKPVFLSCNVAGKTQLELKCFPTCSISQLVRNTMVPEQPIIIRRQI